MNQLYDPPDEVIKLCFLCEKCCKPLLPSVSKRKFKKYDVTCMCGLKYELITHSSNCVIHIDLKYQLEILLQNKDIKDALLKSIRHLKVRENKFNVMRNVYDCLLYKKLKKANSDFHFITLNFSTDGAPLCISAKKSFWPKQAIFNELPP